jgi:hypothetical protein
LHVRPEPAFELTIGLRTCLASLRFGTGPKRSMGHFLGVEKRSFLIRGDDAATVHGGRTSRNLSIRGAGVSLGSIRVDTSRVQSPTPHARRLRSVDTYRQGPLRSMALDHDLPKFWIQSSLKSSKLSRMRRRRLPDPGPIPEGVREPIYIRKK